MVGVEDAGGGPGTLRGAGKKILTYPRAEVRYLPESAIADVAAIVAGLRAGRSYAELSVPSPPVIRRGRNGAIHDKGLEGASHHAVVPNVNTVRLAWLHGSRARGTARLESDIDVAVLLDDDHAASPTAIKDSIWCLAGALGREVRSDRIDLVLLNDAPALLRHRVIRDGILLFARTDAERVRFVLRTIREYQDMEPRLREHTRRWVERLRERRADGRYGDILESARRAGELLGPTVKTQ